MTEPVVFVKLGEGDKVRRATIPETNGSFLDLVTGPGRGSRVFMSMYNTRSRVSDDEAYMISRGQGIATLLKSYGFESTGYSLKDLPSSDYDVPDREPGQPGIVFGNSKTTVIPRDFSRAFLTSEFPMIVSVVWDQKNVYLTALRLVEEALEDEGDDFSLALNEEEVNKNVYLDSGAILRTQRPKEVARIVRLVMNKSYKDAVVAINQIAIAAANITLMDTDY